MFGSLVGGFDAAGFALRRGGIGDFDAEDVLVGEARCGARRLETGKKCVTYNTRGMIPRETKINKQKERTRWGARGTNSALSMRWN